MILENNEFKCFNTTIDRQIKFVHSLELDCFIEDDSQIQIDYQDKKLYGIDIKLSQLIKR